jgi:hypothetical protein
VTAQKQAIDFETLGRQVWDAWSRQWMPASAASASGMGASPAYAPAHGMDGFKAYVDWMQGLAASGMGQGAFAASPAANPFAGWTQPGVQGAAWMPAGLEGLRDLMQTPAFGHTREQQAQQQDLLRAMLDHQQASARYQQLIARAQAEGAQRLQRKLAEPEARIDSLKSMYDLWVDAVEEAYAEIALSDEFREVYAAQGNTQMRVRQLQQQQVEQWCREMGLPTRSEVATLGQRLQELRRELRRMAAVGKDNGAHETGGKDVKMVKPKPAATRTKTRAKAATPGRATTRTPRKSR